MQSTGTDVQYGCILTKNASQCVNQSEIGGNEKEEPELNDYLGVIN